MQLSLRKRSRAVALRSTRAGSKSGSPAEGDDFDDEVFEEEEEEEDDDDDDDDDDAMFEDDDDDDGDDEDCGTCEVEEEEEPLGWKKAEEGMSSVLMRLIVWTKPFWCRHAAS